MTFQELRKFEQAIVNLRPTALGRYDTSNGVIENWYHEDTVAPTVEEIQAEMARMDAEFAANEYKRNRAQNYPALADQLDMLWHAMDTGALPKVDSFYNAIQAVKNEYPKAQ